MVVLVSHIHPTVYHAQPTQEQTEDRNKSTVQCDVAQQHRVNAEH